MKKKIQRKQNKKARSKEKIEPGNNVPRKKKFPATGNEDPSVYRRLPRFLQAQMHQHHLYVLNQSARKKKRKKEKKDIKKKARRRDTCTLNPGPQAQKGKRKELEKKGPV